MNPEEPWMDPTIGQRDGSVLDKSASFAFVANKVGV